MPTGRTHSITTAVLSGIITGGTAFLVTQGRLAPDIPAQAAGAGLLALLVQPDLDVDAGYIGLHLIRQAAGRKPSRYPPLRGLLRLLASAWALYWRPYAVLIPHRSPWSHAPLLGTLVRLAWLAPVTWLLTGYALPPQPMIAVIAVCDTAHAIMDIVYSRYKRIVKA